MPGYWTWSVTQDTLNEDIERLTNELNSFSRKYNPFRIVMEQEQIDPEMDAYVLRFSLAVTSDFEVKERHAYDFVNRLKGAAIEVEKMNESNYTLVRPPRKQGPGMH